MSLKRPAVAAAAAGGSSLASKKVRAEATKFQYVQEVKPAHRFQTVAAYHGEKGLRKQMEDEHLICPSVRSSVPGQKANLPEKWDMGVYAVFDGHGGRKSAVFIRDNLVTEIVQHLTQLADGSLAVSAPAQASVKVKAESGEAAASTNGNGSAPMDLETVPVSVGPSALLPPSAVKAVIRAAFLRLDSRLAIEIPSCKDGCTAVVLFLHGETGYVANLGDSGAVLAREGPLKCPTYKEGQPVGDADEVHAIPLSEAHKPWVPAENHRVLRAGGTVENGRVNGSLEVTRSFGDLSVKRYGVLCSPSYMKFDVLPGKDLFVLLGCDGFWNPWSGLDAAMFLDEALEEERRRSRVEDHKPQVDLRTVCKKAVEYVIDEKKSQDNVSLLLLLFLAPESETNGMTD
uniref:protein-serine/threonine phosphatase n=1 Tax=Chromera velia CCMP2878 TaxID=1169474 RepID=A0A0G4HYW3_9ALVE|mmetsp:Transcript_8103/g.15824  ORF Transcript_8103/g.15824 Transcript_8103/m.15824 type:complete len:401 (-) Transcript_8103:94-1296(-)|eukprot:Cvel_33720.t1-p1 / transcript=Cvel_33720.t1 / gene=Cvel_33720 / organism=Chromera_velia_CCMP2878 / gene_product=Probable protein phosphatase 2C 8, putative / transcript_product=Probable protein phosphatase 2C 8, putative / location=Cvel_scaffold5563:2549-3748(-) / protein_length=400 / sequence_SO=supercontig / SO=protein_coding / is_pseudo=false